MALSKADARWSMISSDQADWSFYRAKRGCRHVSASAPEQRAFANGVARAGAQRVSLCTASMNDTGAAEMAPEVDDTAHNQEATKAASATATGEAIPAPPNRTGRVDSSQIGSVHGLPKIASQVARRSGSARIDRVDPTGESAVRAK